MMKRFAILAAASFAAAMTFSGVSAQTLKMGIDARPTSIDPHFHNNATNSAFGRHVFDGLVTIGNDNRLEGSLAEKWERTSDTVWRIHLRKNVKFHDGSPFTAQDVDFTFKRIPNVPNSPSTFAGQLKSVAELKIIDDHTIDIVTKGPTTTLLVEMINVLIVSKKHGEKATTDDYTAGKAMIGTGPYKFVSSSAGEQMMLARNDQYWGGKEPWEKVEVKVLSNAAARVAALLSGDVDLIGSVPVNDAANIGKNPALKLTEGAGASIVFLSLNVEAEKTIANFATDNNDKVIEKSPIHDPKVRRALSMAIDRDTLIKVALGGGAVPASQIVPKDTFGFDPTIGVEKYDVAGAKKLLAEAGYPNGFKMVFHASNDSIANSVRVVQTIAQMWTQVGVQATLDIMPHAIFITRSSNGEFLHMMHSWGNLVNESSYAMAGVVMTRDAKAGYGTSNRSRYADKTFDKMVLDSMQISNDKEREKKLHETMQYLMKALPVVPLYNPTNAWGSKATVAYTPLITGATLAMRAKPAAK
jgi:peptide/nickel transport system substrate-binding protein